MHSAGVTTHGIDLRNQACSSGLETDKSYAHLPMPTPAQVDVIDFHSAAIQELEPAIVAERAACLRAAPGDAFFVFFRCLASPRLFRP